MKIYISVDLEGISGVISPEQVLPQYKEYEETKKLVADEVNAAIAGVKEAGATQILVNDSHHNMTNIDISSIDSCAELISGGSKKYSMVHGVDETFDAAILLGYHAKAGTPNAIMDHSFYPKEVLDIRVNGISYGEIGLNMLYMAELGVPVVLVTGDKATALETKNLNPSCKTVSVKEAQGRFSAKCIPVERGLKLIRETAREAVLSRRKIEILKVPRNLVLEMDFSAVNLADGASIVPGTERIGAKSIRYYCRNMRELYMWRQVFCGLAAGAYSVDY